jgi:hypothetical protein
MFAARSPNDLLQAVGWSFTRLFAIRVIDLYDDYSRTTFWGFISMITSLHHINLGGSARFCFFTLPLYHP